jgi:hypothetical protein
VSRRLCGPSTGPDKNAYYHPLFLRGKPFLAEYIPRQSVKGNGPRRPSCYIPHLNFYGMPYLPPSRGEKGLKADTAKKDPASAGNAKVGPVKGVSASSSELKAAPVRGDMAIDNGTALSRAGLSENGIPLAAMAQNLAALRNQETFVPSMLTRGAAMPGPSQSGLEPTTALDYLTRRDLAWSYEMQNLQLQRQAEEMVLLHRQHQQNRNRQALVVALLDQVLHR